MFEKSIILNECLKAHVAKNPGESIDIFAVMSRFTLDTICETAMGVNMDAQRSTANEYFKAFHERVFNLDLPMITKIDECFNYNIHFVDFLIW